jgi:glucose-6-phosphate 1-dehydrogenase
MFSAVATNLSSSLSNPLREGISARGSPEPCAVVIFGATGDLTRRKLVPALYNLAHEGQLPSSFAVVGFARSPKTDAAFRAELGESVKQRSRFSPVNQPVWDSLAGRTFFHQGGYDDPAAYQSLADRLREIDRSQGTAGNRLFYIATPPSEFPVIAQHLGASGLVRRPAPGDTGVPSQRVIVEKPIGHSLASARELNGVLTRVFDERQILRIDHYLGKETVQNILVMRFANEIFEPLWNAKYVDHIQITVAESLGVEGRGGYYEGAGAMRDMLQNHMMQLLALVAMEPPGSLEPESIRDEKVKALRAIRPVAADRACACSLRGQYARGSMMGRVVPGYLEENGVSPQSVTETFVALKLDIDNWRWAGVPFYLRTGKRLPKQTAEIAIQFKAPPAVLFAAQSNRRSGAALQPNVLVLRIQPDEGISIRMNSKVPGTSLNIHPVKMAFDYGGTFGARSPDAYERLLFDAITGDSTLFIRGDETECAWSIVDAVMQGWANDPASAPVHPYEAGTWGPPEADAFIRRDGREWRRP